MELHHIDVAGKPITVGCWVATNISGYVYELVLAKVIDLTPQKVRIEYTDTRSYGNHRVRTTIRFPKQLAVVEKDEA